MLLKNAPDWKLSKEYEKNLVINHKSAVSSPSEENLFLFTAVAYFSSWAV